jgi:hypothetical protein
MTMHSVRSRITGNHCYNDNSIESSMGVKVTVELTENTSAQGRCRFLDTFVAFCNFTIENIGFNEDDGRPITEFPAHRDPGINRKITIMFQTGSMIAELMLYVAEYGPRQGGLQTQNRNVHTYTIKIDNLKEHQVFT